MPHRHRHAGPVADARHRRTLEGHQGRDVPAHPAKGVAEGLGRRRRRSPSLITATDIDILNGDYEARTLASVYDYKDGWGSLGPKLADEIAELLTA